MNEEMWEALGFKAPTFIENDYGIKVYIGTKGKEDWCIEVPRELCKLKCPKYYLGYPYRVYLESEEEVLRIAREFTALAESSRSNR